MWSVKQPVEVLFGEGSIAYIGEVLESLGVKRALIISSPSSVRNGAADKILQMKRDFGMPLKLGDLGGGENVIEPLAQGAVANFFGWMLGNCAPQDLD